jgi:hypothetical protein
VDPGQQIIFLLYWILVDETSEMSPDEKVKGFRSGERAGQKKEPPRRKNSVQVFSCVHAEVRWSPVVHEPHLSANV